MPTIPSLNMLGRDGRFRGGGGRRTVRLWCGGHAALVKLDYVRGGRRGRHVLVGGIVEAANDGGRAAEHLFALGRVKFVVQQTLLVQADAHPREPVLAAEKEHQDQQEHTDNDGARDGGQGGGFVPVGLAHVDGGVENTGT